MPLATELAETVTMVRGAVPPPIFEAIGRSISDLHTSGIAARAATVGARPRLPLLPDANARAVDVGALLARGPIVLTFYRGGWCPYCNVTLRALQRVLPDIHALGASLVAVTPELPDRIEASASRADAGFPILHDQANGFARTLGLVFELPDSLRPQYEQLGIDLPASNGDRTFSLPVPATYVLGQDGVVTWAFVDADFTRRAEPGEIIQALRALR